MDNSIINGNWENDLKKKDEEIESEIKKIKIITKKLEAEREGIKTALAKLKITTDELSNMIYS